jgi:malonyl-CoA/methylmalonyl-CoA synthetase
MIASNPLDGARVAGTVGFALPGIEVRVCDADGREPPRGEIGVLEVRGPNVFAGYWRAPEKTSEEMRADGFFITGDVGAMDAEGRVSIVGRAKDVIISGGFNIYPKEIELVLDAVPGVRESAVVGAPHADLGEGVVAVLVAEGEPLAQDVLEASLSRALGRHKHPRRFIWVDALPRNAMGKVAKAELRAGVVDVYGAAAPKQSA